MRYNLLSLTIVSLALLMTGCRKDNASDMSNQEQKQPFNPNLKFFFRGTVDGVRKDWTVNSYKNELSLPYRFSSNSIKQSLTENCKTAACKYLSEDVVIFQNSGAGVTKNYILVGINISSSTGDRNEIIEQFCPGRKSYGKPRSSINDPIKDGVYVIYVDENGKEWSSYYGTGLQTNSSFKSIKFSGQPYQEIPYLNIWKALFTCTLYDKTGNSIQMVDAEIYSPVLVK